MAEAADGACRRSILLKKGAVMKENLVISESASGEKISLRSHAQTKFGFGVSAFAFKMSKRLGPISLRSAKPVNSRSPF